MHKATEWASYQAPHVHKCHSVHPALQLLAVINYYYYYGFGILENASVVFVDSAKRPNQLFLFFFFFLSSTNLNFAGKLLDLVFFSGHYKKLIRAALAYFG